MTIIGLQLGAVLTGTIITETIFAWPGVGPAADPGHQLPRLSARAGLHPVHRRDLRRDEPARRSGLRLARSEDPVPDDAPASVWRSSSADGRSPRCSGRGWCRTIRSLRTCRCGWPGRRWAHPLGLDELGRDVLARLLVGARISLLVGFAVVALSAFVGIGVGAIAGYLGGWTDDVLGRVMDVLLAFPGILLAIALVAVLGPSLRNVVLALVVIGWVGYARLVRGQVLKVRELEYVQAARALGAPVVARAAAPRHPGDVLRGQRAGDARHGGRDHRGSVAQFPRARRAAADAELGHDAGRGPVASVRRAAPDARARAWRSRCWCWASTSRATRSAIGSIRGRRDVRTMGGQR